MKLGVDTLGTTLTTHTYFMKTHTATHTHIHRCEKVVSFVGVEVRSVRHKLMRGIIEERVKAMRG